MVSLLAEGNPDEISFETWLQRFGNKRYTSASALSLARTNFEYNSRRIVLHNAANPGWLMDHNAFSDLSDDEFTQWVGSGLRRKPSRSTPGAALAMGLTTTPASVDWVAAGKVTSVKDQGHCGACWTFGTVGAIEGAYAIASGNLIELSSQDVISCMSKGKCAWVAP